MSCQFCGAMIDRGVPVCSVCGAEQPDLSPRVRTAEKGFGGEVQELMAGPSCVMHPGIPVVGKCPRCAKDVCVRCAPDAALGKFTCTDCEGFTERYRAPPQGALCAVHPQARAAFICSRCGGFACNGCRPEFDTSGRCLKCAPGVLAKATRWSRFWASLEDSCVILAPMLLVGFLAFAGSLFTADSIKNDSDAFALVVVGVMGLGFLMGLGIQLYSQLKWGQSVGKRLHGIKVVRTDGSPIELWRLILLRNLAVQVLTQACGIVGLVDSLLIFGEEQRCLHDYLADSIVVQL